MKVRRKRNADELTDEEWAPTDMKRSVTWSPGISFNESDCFAN
jgi:hypothetical protein